MIGTGTLLDTMRLRVMLSERCEIHPQDIRAYVIGEHGEAQFAAFSSASAGGGPIALPRDVLAQIERDARGVGNDVVRQRGYTNHGIALAMAELIEAIVRDARQVMPLSVRIDGPGDGPIWLSLPVVVGRAGVLKTIGVAFSADEDAAWRRAVDAVENTVRRIEHESARALDGRTAALL